ncbi:RAD55 family ATPase [Thalassoroseus pseudoceratinae]|uniref:RAD55 family ATPase n=1 Tax=Thalassoroseus pseudoceratinae TaxID=2713176 RepID=UPI00141F3E8F|nr:ATPase domain-containing protein [Thalassoroseus pseudoceratinae]
MSKRVTTGLPELDSLLGGGLLPGTLTVVLGATGIGKTQLGVTFANQGLQEDGERGIIFDMTSRGDSQNQTDYAKRLFNWSITSGSTDENIDPESVWDAEQIRRDYLHLFRRSGRRVTFSDLEVDAKREWKTELAKKLNIAIAWFYGNFVHGVRRCVIDGVEPAEKASDSFQFHTFDYVYHQILHKDADWVARDLFRVKYRANAEKVQEHHYRHEDIATLLLYTTHEVMLDDMLARPIESGDVLSNANTIIMMGKTRDGAKMGRALHVAKHRGSACDDRIVPFQITEDGLNLQI